MLKRVCWIFIILILISFYGLTSLFPICSDDFAYSYVFGGSGRVNDLCDVFYSQVNHYQSTNGRFWTHGLVQSLLICDKTVFNVMNVFVYALCTYMMVCVSCSDKKGRLPIWCITLWSFWILMPHPGSSMFWLTGSINYLWVSCINVLFFYVVFFMHVKWRYAFIPLGIIAGNAHEGFSIGLCVMLFYLAIKLKKRDRLFYVLLGSYFLGTFTNIVAPGNYIRLGQNAESVELLSSDYICSVLRAARQSLYSIVSMGDMGLSFSALLFLCSFFLVLIFGKKDSTKTYYIKALLLAAVSCLLLNIYAKVYYSRAFFPFCFFSCFSFVFALSLLKNCRVFKYFMNLFLLFALIINIVEIPKAVISIKSLREMVAYVYSEASVGNSYICNPDCMKKMNWRYVELWGMGTNALYNRPFARYHGCSDFVVLPNDLFQEVKKNKPVFIAMNINEPFYIKENMCVVRLSNIPQKAYILSTYERNYDRGITGWYYKIAMPESVKYDPVVFILDGNYYVLCRISGEQCSLYVDLINGQEFWVLRKKSRNDEQKCANH